MKSVAITAAAAVASSIRVDNFNTTFSAISTVTSTGATFDNMLGPFVPSLLVTPNASFEAADANMIGDRATSVTHDHDATNNTLSVVPGRLGLVFSNGANSGVASFEVTYSNFSADVSAIDDAQFEFTVSSSDLDNRSTPVFLPVTVGLNGIERSVDVSAEGRYALSLDDFSGLDLANINEVTFSFSNGGVFGVDIAFDTLRFVPTPGTVSLLVAASLAPARRRR